MNKDIIEIVDRIVAKKGKTMNQAIPLLQAIQGELNYLPEQALKRVCEITDITPSQIYGVSTFYSQFRHKPAGKHFIKVCVGTACHVKGANRIFEAFKRELNLKPGEDTDEDGIFTVEEVACLGCCAIAPAVQIDEVTYGYVETGKVSEILTDFLTLSNQSEEKSVRVVSEGKVVQGEVRIALDSCCVASGNLEVKEELERTLDHHKINVNVKQVGCVGICNQIPMIEIHKPGEDPFFYTRLKPEDVSGIVHRHFKPDGLVQRFKSKLYSYAEKSVYQEIPSTARKYDLADHTSPLSVYKEQQVNIATEHLGLMMPLDIKEYLSKDGFLALRRCLNELTPKEVIAQIKRSGLKGRGGAGFPSANKWQLVHDAQSDQKYVICNGDEGDPGAFMDRMLLESFPFRIIEGIVIAAYAVGASEGILYIRAEYPLSIKNIGEAIKLCKKEGILGDNILGSQFSFNLRIFEGAGAFVCGEETALIASVEGKRGIPVMRPPYPSERGLEERPTLINNTETFSLVPWIIRHGGEQFAKIGTQNSKGTKVFALAGKINRGGLIEVPMGTTLRQIVEEIGGGIPDGKEFKAVQIGGPSGGCIPASMADIPIDYNSLIDAGAMMGSGGLVVLDNTDCMVDIARYFLTFTQNQSCGRCTFCRIGTRRMLELLDEICSGKAKLNDLDVLEQLAYNTKKGSLCGLGQSAPNPVLSTLRYFRDEYEAHIKGECPASKCKELISYEITADCDGCTKCAQRCPSQAIVAKPYEMHVVDIDLCLKCDVCRQVCPKGAVVIKNS